MHSIGTTFCLWNNLDGKWEIGDVTDLNDGSENLLGIFDNNPQTYIDWAKEYYEDGIIIDKNTYGIVSNIYHGQPLTKEMVLSLVDELEDWDQLEKDMQEINYPYRFM